MNLYLISQTENDNYDTYDSAVVAAESEDDARRIHPGSGGDFPSPDDEWSIDRSTWCLCFEAVTVKFLCSNYKGERGVILASFNAG